MDAQSLVAGLTVGASVGVLVGGIFAAGRKADDDDLLISARSSAKYWEAKARDLGKRCAELVAEKTRRDSGLKAGNAKRHAEKLAREAEEAARRAALHEDIRKLTEGLI